MVCAARSHSGVKFRRQHQIGSFIVDFCCVEKKLVVELDGGQHATRTEADEKRTRFLRARGYRVLRFWNDDVVRDADAVATVIMKELEKEEQAPSPAHAACASSPATKRER
jgi:very-short-patch-repair endonuclease